MIDIGRLPRFSETQAGRNFDDFINRTLGIIKDGVSGLTGALSEGLGGEGISAGRIAMVSGSIATTIGNFLAGGRDEPAVGQVRSPEISAPAQAQTQTVSPFECNMNDVCVPAGLPNLRTGGVGIGTGV